MDSGLKKIVTPLFAGLMEVDPQRMWNFDRFFQEVIALVSSSFFSVIIQCYTINFLNFFH